MSPHADRYPTQPVIYDGSDYFHCPGCPQTWDPVFDLHAGQVRPNTELDFDALHTEWVARTIKELTWSHVCPYPHTAFQLALNTLDACNRGRRFVGTRTVAEFWGDDKTPVEYYQWLLHQVRSRPQRVHAGQCRDAWVGDEWTTFLWPSQLLSPTVPVVTCRECAVTESDLDLDVIRSLWPVADVLALLERKFPHLDFTTNLVKQEMQTP